MNRKVRMKIYTKTGDTGETSLFGGGRVSKISPRLKAYGTVDELNSSIGVSRSMGLSEEGDQICDVIQNNLFILGADLSTPQNTRAQRIKRISEDQIKDLEIYIDQLQDALPPLKYFILPGGCPGAAALHLSRTICRRAERETIACLSEEPISATTVKYLNRLSDLLFVLARYENKMAGVLETAWQAGDSEK